MLHCSPPAGGPGHTGRMAPRRSHSRTEVGCGDISAPNLGLHDVGVSPLADRRSKVPAHGRGTPDRAGPPSGCSRGRVGDSCARSIPEPAPARLPPPCRAAPSNPHRSRATPPAALSANTALVCTGAPGLGVRGWQGLPWGPASSSACPSSSASAGSGVPGAENGECSTPTSTTLGGWSQPGPDWRAGARIV